MLKTARAFIFSAVMTIAMAVGGNGALAAQGSVVMPVAGPMSMATFVTTFLNPGLQSLFTGSSGSSSPVNGIGAAPATYQWWWDNSASPSLLKVRDGSQWVTAASLDTSAHTYGLVGATAGIGGWSNANIPLTISKDGTVPSSSLFATTDTVALSNSGANLFRLITASAVNTDSGQLNFVRSRGTPGTPTITVSGDVIGNIIFNGYDGASRKRAARIQAFVDGTPGASDMPGRLEFETTPDGTALSVTRLIINNAGLLVIGATQANTVPALKPSGTTLQSRLGNDSAFSPFQGKLTTDTNYTNSASTPTGYLVFYDATGTAYEVPAKAH